MADKPRAALQAGKSFRVSIGANNLFDIYPAKIDAVEYAAGGAAGFGTETVHKTPVRGFFGAFFYAKVQYSL